VPLALVALALAAILVPSHVNEGDQSVDNLGGVLSIIGVISLVLAINFAPSSGDQTIAVIAGGIAVVALAAFLQVQRRARSPLFDLGVASRRIFWVAALAGLIVFGTLMGSMYVGQQFLQNVLGYSTLKAGASVLPAAFAMVVVAPLSARMIHRFGSRVTLLCGYGACLASLSVMLVAWTAHASELEVALAFVLLGVGVGLAGTPASHSLTGSVPIHRAGMASGTADLQRDLGGSIMQSILGAILTAGYARAVGVQLVGKGASDQVTSVLERSYASAADYASQVPANEAAAIVKGAKDSFLQGADWAYAAGMVLIVVGAAVVWVLFPKKGDELALLESYGRVDAPLTR
jgi:MFS family permease